ncbi:MAG: hypothetical protein HC831_05800 [Chloroflexia bacterium]|nr:hypothetical protein [Chloroflexia bacterium]
MTKKEIILPITVLGLTLLFAGICVAVFLTNGKSKKWVTRKMKIGGLMLTLTAASCNGGGGEVMCYETVAVNNIWMENQGEKGIEIMLDTGNVLTGHLTGAQDSVYSFSVSDKNNQIFQRGELLANDGKFDQMNEIFTIKLDKSLSPGDYILHMFPTGVETQDSSNIISQMNLKIKND